MRIIVLGLSLSSSWGNGHATTYRSLLKGFAAGGHDVLFLERDQPWYAANRDLPDPDFCDLRLYDSLADLDRYRDDIGAADAVVVGSYVPDGPAVIAWANAHRRHKLAFYDIDTPVTLQGLAEGSIDYLNAESIPLFDLYLSFTGGPTLDILHHQYHARRAVPLYCSVDPDLYHPTTSAKRWALGYLGTYSADRQGTVDRLLLEPARRLPDKRFVVAGSQYPADIVWPANVDRIEHLPPSAHADFYSSLCWTLNVTRRDMIRSGYSPSVRLFEATACGVPVLSDRWAGMEEVLAPDRDLLVVDTSAAVVAALSMPLDQRQAIASSGRRSTLLHHTGRQRADELVRYLTAPSAQPNPTPVSFSDTAHSRLPAAGSAACGKIFASPGAPRVSPSPEGP
jgi:spore maturation protein CgeB